LRAAKSIKVEGENDDEQAGIDIVRKALEAPVRQIAENAGLEGSVVVNTIVTSKGKTYGFNAQTEEYGDLVTMGVIDPAKVVRSSLQNAASVAGLLITTEAAIADAPKSDDAPAGGGMPDMGGMGGMGGMGF
ncbi:MAG: TCP-1/cpn60 chaperonin family protein, partial [Hyphomonas sp.]